MQTYMPVDDICCKQYAYFILMFRFLDILTFINNTVSTIKCEIYFGENTEWSLFVGVEGNVILLFIKTLYKFANYSNTRSFKIFYYGNTTCIYFYFS